MLRSLWAFLLRKPPIDASVAHALLDVLPPECQLIAEFSEDKIRFRAIDAHGVGSEWSRWFTWTGETIHLKWDTFWIED